MKVPVTNQTRTAYHEAGHAVLAYVGGLKISELSIEPDEDTFGRTVYYFVNSWLATQEFVNGRAQQRIEACILYYLAGLEAEARFAGRRYRHGAIQDIEDATTFAWHIVLSYSELELYLRWLEVRTQYLVKQHWRLIDRLARRLLQCETMTAREVQKTLGTILYAPRSRRRRRRISKAA